MEHRAFACAVVALSVVACSDNGALSVGGAGQGSGGSVAGASSGGANAGQSAMGGSAASPTTSGTAGTPGAGGGGTGSGSGGSSGASGGNAGAASGGAAGTAGTSGSGGNAGGAGNGGSAGAACGTLEKAADGSYVRSSWSGEYTCSGGDCPPKNQDDKGDVAINAFDGNYQTRWSTGVFQSALDQQQRFPLFFTVDLKQAVTVSKLTAHPGCKDYYDAPGTIEVQVSMDGSSFTTVTAMPHTPQVPQGEPCPPNDSSVATDTITFPTTCARYLRLKSTRRTTSDRYWAIGELKAFP